MKTVLVLLGMFLRAIAVLISLIAGAIVLLFAGLLGELQDSNP